MNARINLFCNEDVSRPDYVTLLHDGGTVMLEIAEHKHINGVAGEPTKACAFMLPIEARLLAGMLNRFADDCAAAGKEGGE